jgi:hypothetical protein
VIGLVLVAVARFFSQLMLFSVFLFAFLAFLDWLAVALLGVSSTMLF